MRRSLGVSKLCWVPIISTAVLISSCGGGGGGEERKLVVDFSYSQRDLQLWKPVSMPISATGLEGNTPNCEVAAGRLPAGMTLEATGCTIAGTPTEVTILSPTIRLTVKGFQGQVDKPINLIVNGPPDRYGMPGNIYSFRAGAPLSVTPISANGQPWTRSPGETLRYELASGTLPEGLRLNPDSGELSGVFTTRAPSEDFNYVIRVTSTTTLGSASSESQPQLVRVDSGLRIDYVSDCACFIGVFRSISPTHGYSQGQSGPAYSLSNFRLASSSGTLPPGLSLSATTGEISGTTTTSGEYEFSVIADVSTGGQTATISAGSNRWLVR